MYYCEMHNHAEYQRAVAAAKTEILELAKQRAAIDSRLRTLRRSMKSLERLLKTEKSRESGGASYEKSAQAQPGLTASIRKVLQRHSSLTTLEIRTMLSEEEGLDINIYASGLTIIHNTLKRMQNQGEINLEKGPNGTVASVIRT